MTYFIPVNEPLLDGNEAKYLQQCIETGWISSEGPFVQQFEEKMAQYIGRKYGIAVANGTVALDLAIEALPLKEGDEVIIPTFTIISCAAPLVRRGIVPICVDCDPETFVMQAEGVKSAITENTRAIMPVHIYGLPVDMDPILKLAQQHDLFIIEDAAEAHGLTYKNQPCGSFGDLSIFSFYPNKHVTTGEGGMVLTDNKELAQRCRSLRNLCFNERQRFVHEELGFNYRMSNVQAALGCAQLERLDEFVSRKHSLGKNYTRLFKPFEEYLQLPRAQTPFAQNVYWVYPLVLKDTVPIDAHEFMQRLGTRGIGTRPFFYPMHRQPVFLKQGLFQEVSLPYAEHIAERGFYIPSGLALTAEQQERVANEISSVLSELGCTSRS